MKIDLSSIEDREVVDYIKTLPKQLVENAYFVQFKKDSIVVNKGERVRFAYLILKGECSVFNYTTDGKAYYWLTLAEHTVVSDLEFFADKPVYAASVVAASNVLAFKIPIDEFTKAIYSDFAFAMKIVHRFASNACANSYNMENAVYKSSYEKVGIYLARRCMLFDKSRGTSLIIASTRQNMAEELGLSVKTINRAVNKLHEEGLIDVAKGKIYIEHKQMNILLDKWGNQYESE